MTKNFKHVKRKIRELSKDEEKKDNLVIQNGNIFHVYNEYRIVKNGYKFDIYINDGNEFIGTVFNSSTAISWCNAHKGNDVVLSNNIITTDRGIEFLNNDISYTKMLIKLRSTPHPIQSILFTKLTEYVDKQLRLKLKLHKYIQRSNQIKDKGFSNEFTAPNKANNFNRVR